MIRALFFMFIIATISSCCRKTYPVQSKLITTDSLYIHDTTIIRDTVITIAGSNASVDITNEELNKAKPGEVINKTKAKQATVKITKTENGIKADCDCDTISIEAKLYDKIRQETRQQTRSETIVQEVKYVPLMVKILAYIGGALVVFIVGFVIKKIWF